MSDVTRILDAAQKGDPKAAEQLLPLLYDELRRLAAAKMAQEAHGQTLQPTALVHEAWLRLVGLEQPDVQKWRGRAHFFGAAAEAMRRHALNQKYGFQQWMREALLTLQLKPRVYLEITPM